MTGKKRAVGPLLRRRSWIPVWIRRRTRRQRVTLRLHVLLDLFDRPVELLVFAAEFLRGIVINHNVGIDGVTFDDPFLSILRKRCELRPEELATVGKGKRIAN